MNEHDILLLSYEASELSRHQIFSTTHNMFLEWEPSIPLDSPYKEFIELNKDTPSARFVKSALIDLSYYILCALKQQRSMNVSDVERQMRLFNGAMRYFVKVPYVEFAYSLPANKFTEQWNLLFSKIRCGEGKLFVYNIIPYAEALNVIMYRSGCLQYCGEDTSVKFPLIWSFPEELDT